MPEHDLSEDEVEIYCEECDGTGWVYSEWDGGEWTCRHCNGRGRVFERRLRKAAGGG